MPIFYVFKYENGQKLSSHMWFFKGFCELLKPEYCLLMDAGAIPKEKAICKLIFAMAQNDKIGGVCGTMRIDLS
jgi:chitin synthase